MHDWTRLQKQIEKATQAAGKVYDFDEDHPASRPIDLFFQETIDDSGTKAWINFDVDDVEVWSEWHREFDALAWRQRVWRMWCPPRILRQLPWPGTSIRRHPSRQDPTERTRWM